MKLSGKTALITGAGRGIGRTIALEMAREGADVAAGDIDLVNLESLAGEIKALGRQSLPVKVDVTKMGEVRGMVEKALERFGKIDILVNNAGVWRIKSFIETTEDEWSREIGICLYGTLNCSRAVLEPMIKRNYGRIINIGSDAGRIGEPTMAVYSAAKAGIIGFTKALAKEVGRYNITVNAVCPGITETPGAAPTIEAWGRDKIARLYPIRRLGKPEDIAPAVVFFASDNASWITGQTLSVSGGYTTV